MKTITTLGYRGVTARLLLVALAPFALDGCLSVNIDRTRQKMSVADARGSLEARLYETGKDLKGDVKSRREVTWKLFHLDASREVPLREGTGPTWSATDLPSGKYRISAEWGPKPDVPGDASTGKGDDTFSLAPGDSARADVVLKKFPVWAAVAIVLSVIGIAALILTIASLGRSIGTINLSSKDTPGGDPQHSETPNPGTESTEALAE